MTQHAVLPSGFHSITPRMVVNDVAAQVEFLRAVFDATGEIHSDRPGAVSIEAPVDTPYGDRRAMVHDASGNILQIAHRSRSAMPRETIRRGGSARIAAG
jgi:PhnB protein